MRPQRILRTPPPLIQDSPECLGRLIRNQILYSIQQSLEAVDQEIKSHPNQFVYLTERHWMLSKFRSSIHTSAFKLDATWWIVREKMTLGDMINEFMDNRKRKGYGTGPNRPQVRASAMAPENEEARSGHNPAVEQNAV